jgi:hypothetical protein
MFSRQEFTQKKRLDPRDPCLIKLRLRASHRLLKRVGSLEFISDGLDL